MKVLALLVALICAAQSANAGELIVHDAWARATAGRSTIGAAYLTLKNAGSTADRLISATTPVAGSVELHASIQDGDVMRMQKLDSIELAPDATVEFKPSGMHMMLVGVAAPLKQGTSFPLTLMFASGKSAKVEVAVMGPGASGPAKSHHH
jgi:copper(I)-binding protein